MVSEYNIKPFGFNVLPDRGSKGGAVEQTGKAIEHAIGNLWEPVLDYLKTNESVFSGDVSSEIRKVNMQTMQLGTVVNGGNEIHNIDIQS